jgi:hypothetical protein
MEITQAIGQRFMHADNYGGDSWIHSINIQPLTKPYELRRIELI